MKILAPVSLGELLDKISILRIKQSKITDRDKLKFINDEMKSLTKFADNSMVKFIKQLESINKKIWDVEDKIRKKEIERVFDDSFVQLARSIYRLNDKRFKIKDKVNKKFGSEIREQKQYEKYT